MTGAYLFIEHIQTSGGIKHPVLTPFATLVYLTDRQLPRSADGSPNTGGATIAGQGGSIGSVHGRASRCYEVAARIKPDNTITGTVAGQGIIQTKASVGSRIPVTFTSLRHGTTVRRTVTLRSQRPGDTTGKPLGCCISPHRHAPAALLRGPGRLFKVSRSASASGAYWASAADARLLSDPRRLSDPTHTGARTSVARAKVQLG